MLHPLERGWVVGGGYQFCKAAPLGSRMRKYENLSPVKRYSGEPLSESSPVPLKEDQQFFIRQGQEAIRKALSMLEDKEGWKVEITEVTPYFS